MSARAPISRPRYAFTLIELLVVVAIIGLLVSILLPSLRTAREQAKAVICLTRMKAQYDAASAYADENRDIFVAGIVTDGPPNWLGNPAPRATDPEVALAHQLWLPYLGYQIPMDKINNLANVDLYKWERLFADRNGNAYRGGEGYQRRMDQAFGSIEVYECPSFPEVVSKDSSTVIDVNMTYVTNAMPYPFTTQNVGLAGSLEYSIEEYYAGVPKGTVHYFDKRKRASITRPADIMYIGEADESVAINDLENRGEGGGFGNPGGGGGPPSLSYMQNAIFVGKHLPLAAEPRIDNEYDDQEIKKRHPGGSNLMFFDGHGETMSYRKQDPGHENAPFAIRLRYFSDPSKLPAQWQ